MELLGAFEFIPMIDDKFKFHVAYRFVTVKQSKYTCGIIQKFCGTYREVNALKTSGRIISTDNSD
jgi:hypothetical protein